MTDTSELTASESTNRAFPTLPREMIEAIFDMLPPSARGIMVVYAESDRLRRRHAITLLQTYYMECARAYADVRLSKKEKTAKISALVLRMKRIPGKFLPISRDLVIKRCTDMMARKGSKPPQKMRLDIGQLEHMDLQFNDGT